MKLKFSLLWGSAIVFLAGCANVGPSPKSAMLAEVSQIMTGASQTQPAVVAIQGVPAILYANRDNRVVFQLGDRKTLLDTTAPVQGGNRFQLNPQGDDLHVQWWSHENAKNLYFTSTNSQGAKFAPVSIVNEAHGVLPPISLLRGPTGTIGMTYHDERAPRTQIYFNKSTDNGLTWRRPDARLDTPPPGGQSSLVLEPQSVESNAAWVAAWVDGVTELGKTSYRVLYSRSDDFGDSWSKPQVVFSSDQHIASLTLKARGATVVLAAEEHERGIFAFTSKDEGRTWKGAGLLPGTVAPAGTEGANNSGASLTVSKGFAHLVWMNAHNRLKPRIMRGRLDLAETKWIGAAERLDVKEIDNTQSLSPVVAEAIGGQLVSAWVDYRDIRPNIYLSASFDEGASWTAPVPLGQPGEMSLGLPKFVQWEQDLAITYEAYPADRAKEGKFIVRTLGLGKQSMALPNVVGMQRTQEQRKARLLERVKTFWESRIADNYKVSYDMFDFAYRSVAPEKTYLSSVGLLTYHSYEVLDTTIAGNVAQVKTKLKYEIQPTVLANGRTLKLEPTEAEPDNTWVWVKDDWYIVYKPSPGEPNLKY